MEQHRDSTEGNFIIEMMSLLLNQSDEKNVSNYYNDTDYMDPYDPSVHDIILGNLQRQAAICGVFLTVATFITNSLVIISCLKNASTRSDAFYIQIVNFAFSNLLVSVIVLPFTVYYILHPWELGKAVCRIWVVLDIMIPFASMTILLILNIDRILAMSHPGAYKNLFQKCVTLVTITPWVVAVVIVVPLWSLGTLPFKDIPGECIVIINTEAALLCHVLTFFIPLVLLVLFTLRMLFLRLKPLLLLHNSQSTEELSMQNQSDSTQSTLLEEAHGGPDVHIRQTIRKIQQVPRSTISSVCAVNFFFAGMWFPFQCFSVLLTTCTSQRCIPSIEVNQAVTWMGTASAAVIPLIWLIDDKLRHNVKTMFNCKTEQTRKDNGSHSLETFL